MTTLSRKPKRDNQLGIATALLVISLAINVGTVANVVNRPVEAIVVHKADNATVLHGKITGKEMGRQVIHARLRRLREIPSE